MPFTALSTNVCLTRVVSLLLLTLMVLICQMMVILLMHLPITLPRLGFHCRNPEVPSLHSIDVVEHDILAAIDKLKNNPSAGPDGLPPMLFKRIKFSIIVPLVLLYKQLLSSCLCA